MHINDLLKIASERKASDLHLKVGSHPVLRINGELIPLVETKRLMQEVEAFNKAFAGNLPPITDRLSREKGDPGEGTGCIMPEVSPGADRS